mmetsp:Transcript_16693/g.43953  ORF Transcript_16693/g.43953 Transcript_16693/m.43953 type:complete len:132 (-) Transcript_16693:293-688(-)
MVRGARLAEVLLAACSAVVALAQDNRNSTVVGDNSADGAGGDNSADGAGQGIPMSYIAVAAVLLLVCGGYQAFRYLINPKRTPAPLLADNELGEGDPVQDSTSSMWMGGGGLSQARQMVTDQQQSAGFTQF